MATLAVVVVTTPAAAEVVVKVDSGDDYDVEE